MSTLNDNFTFEDSNNLHNSFKFLKNKMSGFKIGKLKFKDNGSVKPTAPPKKIKKVEEKQ